MKFSVSRMYKQTKKTEILMEAAKQLFQPASMSALTRVFSFYCSNHLLNKPSFFRGSLISAFFSTLVCLPVVICDAYVWEEILLISWIFSKFTTEMYKATPYNYKEFFFPVF